MSLVADSYYLYIVKMMNKNTRFNLKNENMRKFSRIQESQETTRANTILNHKTSQSSYFYDEDK